MSDIIPEDVPFDELTTTVRRKCLYCGKLTVLEVNANSLREWKDGKLIQEAFPKLSIHERETIQTGTCRACWELYLGEK